jgi:hypothetical protein
LTSSDPTTPLFIPRRLFFALRKVQDNIMGKREGGCVFR